MRRLHLIEIADQPWFPCVIRDAVTDTLQFTFNACGLYGPVIPHLNKVLRISGARKVLDLCSGSGGPWLRLQRQLEEDHGLPVTVRLSDKYPNLAALQRLQAVSNNKITFHPDSVDAKAVQSDHKEFLTMFTCFHHFRPDDARTILRNAAQNHEGIGVFEVPQRRPLAILLTILMPVAAFVFVPFIRPFRWSRLLWTYVIPVVPFVLLFDGIVSCLRAYTPAELAELAASVPVSGYRWEAGEVRGAISPIPVTYLIGWPDDASTAISPQIPLVMRPARGISMCGSATRAGQSKRVTVGPRGIGERST
jgi:hypothetical protein